MINKIEQKFNNLFELDTTRFKRKLLLYGILISIPIILIAWIFDVFRIYFIINSESYLRNVVYTIANALTVYGIANAFGFFNKPSQRLRNITIIILIFLLATGLFFYDIVFHFNFWFLQYTWFGISSEHGILFVAGNTFLILFLYILSFTLEHENRSIE